MTEPPRSPQTTTPSTTDAAEPDDIADVAEPSVPPEAEPSSSGKLAAQLALARARRSPVPSYGGVPERRSPGDAGGGDGAAGDATSDDGRGDCPVAALGQRNGVYWFVKPNGEVVSISYQQLTTMAGLSFLFDGDVAWLTESFPRTGRGGEVTGFVATAAGAGLIRRCAEAGLFDASLQIRGRGVWPGPRGSVIMHCGDGVIIDGILWPPGCRLDGALYRAMPPIPPPADTAATAQEGQAARDELAGWRFRHDSAPEIVLGFIGLAMLGAIPRWRAHLLITGEAGSGKSMLAEAAAAALGPLCVYYNDVTEAGLRQTLTSEARPIVLDETEKSGSLKVERVIELLRLMSSGRGAGSLRGSREGLAQQYHAVGCAALFAIDPPELKPQDRSRITEVEVLLPDPAALEQADNACRQLAALGPKLLCRMLQRVAAFESSFANWREALVEIGCTARQAEQPASFLAAYWTLVEDTPISLDIARHELPRYLWMIETASTTLDDDVSQQCLNHLLASQVEQRSGETLTLSRLIVRARSSRVGDARGLLQAYGVRLVEDSDGSLAGAWVANRHPQLNRIFAGTAWQGGGWRRALASLPGASKPGT
ncbi:MAG: hypothetical protein KIS72_11250, partial [Luteimonas sp.]|nr:hypothetical protein [Luteimonas sp.]